MMFHNYYEVGEMIDTGLRKNINIFYIIKWLYARLRIVHALAISSIVPKTECVGDDVVILIFGSFENRTFLVFFFGETLDWQKGGYDWK